MIRQLGREAGVTRELRRSLARNDVVSILTSRSTEAWVWFKY